MLRKIALYPFEWITLAAVVATTTVFTALDLPFAPASITYTLGAAARVLPMTLVVGVGLFSYYHYARGGELRPYLRHLMTPAWVLLWLRLWLACWIVSFCYFWVKVFVPLIHAGTSDAALWQFDKWLHLGYSPNEVTIQLLQGTRLVDWLDYWYALWLATVIWSLAFFAASETALLRRRIVLSALLMWIGGVTLYVVFPALGPIFVFESNWDGLKGSLPRAEQAQQALRDNYQSILAIGSDRQRPIDHRLGVAALPSLHVGFHFLFALWARREMRVLLLPLLGMTLLTFVASLLTGWHYAVDGYAGMALAYLSYRMAVWLEPDQQVNTCEKDSIAPGADRQQ